MKEGTRGLTATVSQETWDAFTAIYLEKRAQRPPKSGEWAKSHFLREVIEEYLRLEKEFFNPEKMRTYKEEIIKQIGLLNENIRQAEILKEKLKTNLQNVLKQEAINGVS